MNTLQQLVQITNSLAWCKKVADTYTSGEQLPLTNTFRVYLTKEDIIAGPVDVGDKAKSLSGGNIDPISATHLENAFLLAVTLLSQVSSEELETREKLKTHQEFLVTILSLRDTLAKYLKWYGEQKNPKRESKVVEVEDIA